ncbi:MAG: hypothetical protein D6693_04115 [Planctomycetota bacterium]|nr:MAG: hypothetical protein D6693_04115 [Planctomycetota bacterium]
MVLLGRNARRVAATLALVVVAPALGQAGSPTPREAMAAFHEVESWVREWAVPDEPVSPDPAGATGACVTLRLEGDVVGRATVVSDAGDAVWRASRAALAQASQAMPVERDALRRERLRALAPSVEIDLQIAGPWTPIVAETLTEAALTVAPARQGVAARAGERAEAVFPGVMAASNMTPGDGITAALGALGLAPTPLATLREETGLVLYRFDVQHLTQPTAGAEPVFLTRSGRVVSTREITPASLRRFGDRLTINLIRRRWPGEEPFGVQGTYLPWRDEYEPAGAAEPLDQALTAYALARWLASGHGSPELREPVMGLTRRILRDLAIVGEGEADPTRDAAVASLRTLAEVTLTMGEGARPPAGDAPVAPAPMVQPDAEPPPAPVRAIRALANAQNARLRGLDELADAARAEVRDLFARTPPASLPALSPWLMFAELALAQGADRVPSAVALRRFREQVESRQITLADAAPTGDEDLVGGVVFGAGDAALPTWHTLRPMIALARMIADDRLTSPEERPAHLARLLDGVRFARQLAADDAVCAMFPDRDRARWGVRAAVWDQRQPVQATALALLLVTETLDAVDALTADRPETDRPPEP